MAVGGGGGGWEREGVGMGGEAKLFRKRPSDADALVDIRVDARADDRC